MKLSDIWRRKPKAKGWTDTDQGWMHTSWDAGWWQQDLKAPSSGLNETVEACVSTLAQTTAMCPIQLLEAQDDGADKRLTGSLPERVLLNPNPYTTRSLFFVMLIRSIYFHGNGYAVVSRDGNRAINGLYNVDPKSINGVIDPETNDVYYWVGKNYGMSFNPDTDMVYPARDVLNIRINARANEPLRGETPITVAAKSISANSAIVGHQSAFFNNMSRPSGIISTDQQLTKEQMLQIREAYYQQSKAEDSGKVPILGNGMKWAPMSLSSQDAQLVQAFGMTVESISRVFRVPLPLINAMNGATYSNTEAMFSWFLSSGLGFLLEHIELELNKLFNLPQTQRLNFNTRALLRSDSETRMKSLQLGVLSGIYSPDEARAMEGYGAVPGGVGKEPRVQQQVVPLSAWEQSMKEPAPEPPPVDVAAAFNKGYASVR